MYWFRLFVHFWDITEVFFSITSRMTRAVGEVRPSQEENMPPLSFLQAWGSFVSPVKQMWVLLQIRCCLFCNLLRKRRGEKIRVICICQSLIKARGEKRNNAAVRLWSSAGECYLCLCVLKHHSINNYSGMNNTCCTLIWGRVCPF